MKVVVFDLDETLGCFTQLGIFWQSLEHFAKTHQIHLTQQDFDDTLDLFPEFIRPNIIPILNYLKTKKQGNMCHKLLIYTNNTGPKEWSQQIIRFFESKIHYKLVDQIIAAFKINGKQVEMCRTTYEKTHDDLIRCTKIPTNAEICFIDDAFYPKMANDNVYYINLKPFFYDLPMDYMIYTFEKSALGQKISKIFESFTTSLEEEIQKYHYKYTPKNAEEYEIDKILGKHILSHLKIFFEEDKIPITKKNNKKLTTKCSGGKTRKLYYM